MLQFRWFLVIQSLAGVDAAKRRARVEKFLGSIRDAHPSWLVRATLPTSGDAHRISSCTLCCWGQHSNHRLSNFMSPIQSKWRRSMGRMPTNSCCGVDMIPKFLLLVEFNDVIKNDGFCELHGGKGWKRGYWNRARLIQDNRINCGKCLTWRKELNARMQRELMSIVTTDSWMDINHTLDQNHEGSKICASHKIEEMWFLLWYVAYETF